ncbi:MAG: tRNA (adenosine(37)-N6)-threonylcarbamoyltransferase complex transferase subunit TsaD [Patescibacteria group bacterium]|nr:tRNA (adenosine(37)-N6)-threonylcarbamoyltransferase complex transferase subunit TsaD [Patescibacteria group bacterium]
MKILAIETSCDESAMAVLKGRGSALQLEKSLLYSQAYLHHKYGGVVPELAAREHLQAMVPLLDNLLGKKKLQDIDCLAVTAGPGLVTSLVLGVSLAKTLAYANQLPLVPVNHIAGHIYSNWLSHPALVKNEKKYLPALALVVSGGHSELLLIKGHSRYRLIGRTLDDAVGEAFDKVAKLLNLGYPGGPIVSQLAQKGEAGKYNFPRPMLTKNNFDFSFAGLKTAVLYALEKKKNISAQDINDICASFQEAVIEVLTYKSMAAAKRLGVKSLMLSGGVSANQDLKQSLAEKCRQSRLPFFFPDVKYSGDNAAMIATAAYYQYLHQPSSVLKGRRVLSLAVQSNWRLG